MIRQEQGVAAGENDVAHFGMLAQVGNGLFEFAFLEESWFPNQPFSRAEPTINRTLVRHHQQDTIRIAMDKMWDWTHEVFLERIILRFEVVHLSDIRDHLFPNGVALFFHRRHHRGGNSHWIVTHDSFDFLRVETEPVRQVFWFHNAVSEYASPCFHAVSFTIDRGISRPACEGVLLLFQTCRPSKFCCAEMVFPQSVSCRLSVPDRTSY